VARKILGITDPGDSTHIGSNDFDYINKYLTGVDQSSLDPVNIATTTTYNSNKLGVYNNAKTSTASFIFGGTSNTSIDVNTIGTATTTGSYNTIVYKSGSICIAVNSFGTLINSGTGTDATVINAAIQNTPAGGTLVITPGLYTFDSDFQNAPLSGNIIIRADITIFGYGATIKATTSTGSIFLVGGSSNIANSITQNLSFQLYGLTLNMNKLCNNGVNGGQNKDSITVADDITVKLVKVVDCTFLNTIDTSIHISAASGGAANSTVIVENCFFDAGSTNTIDEHIVLNSVQVGYIRNCTMLGNKSIYGAARTLRIHNIYADANGLTTASGIQCHGSDIGISNVHLKGLALFNIRPFCSTERLAPYADLYNCSITGVSQ